MNPFTYGHQAPAQNTGFTQFQGTSTAFSHSEYSVDVGNGSRYPLGKSAFKFESNLFD